MFLSPALKNPSSPSPRETRASLSSGHTLMTQANGLLGGSAVKIGIIGTGKMARGFSAALASDHVVILGSRTPDQKAGVGSKLGVGVTTYRDAARKADVVVLTVPWSAMDSVLPELGPLTGKVVVDVSFPYSKAERDTLKGTSTAEEIQRRIPKARVCKGWNHVHHLVLTNPVVNGIESSVLIAGDDARAKKTVARLAADMRFHPVDVGPLRATRELERLVAIMLFVRLGPFRVLTA